MALYTGDLGAYPPFSVEVGYQTRLGLLRGLNEGEVMVPSDRIAFGCTWGNSFGHPGPIMRMGLYQQSVYRASIVPVGKQHDARPNVVFCDAHVESDKADRWSAPTKEARRRWHADNQPPAELWPEITQ